MGHEDVGRWELVLIGLQSFQVLFLWLHDWIPFGRLNDVAAVRRENTTLQLAVVTLVQSLPFTVGLVYSLRALGHAYPGWLNRWLWISYVVLFAGQLMAWWVPYLLKPDPVRAARYQKMFGKTHAFLPVRHGIVPNTAHILLHLATAATLLALFAMNSGS